MQVPRVGVGGVVIADKRVLLVKRGRPPAQGLWAIPGGKVHWGESLTEAVIREVAEETGLQIEPLHIVETFDQITRNPDGEVIFHYIIIDYLARLVSTDRTPTPGDDADDAAWIALADLADLPVAAATRQLLERLQPANG